MERVSVDVEGFHLGIADLDALLVGSRVERTLDLQARGIADGIVLSWLAIWILPKGWVAAYGGWDGRVSGLLFGS